MRSLRDQFLLRPDVVYLNNGSLGACLQPVFAEYQRWQRELESEPYDFIFSRLRGCLDGARAALAAYVGAPAEDLIFVPNATTGLNLAARALDLRPGDEVLATDHEYGALDLTWDCLAKKTGCRYVRRHLPLPFRSKEEIVETVWAGVTPRTRALFLSHITSPLGFLLPVEELVRRARAAGLAAIVDGAHAPGQVPLDLAALGADFYAGSCHKWMQTPKGTAFLYARKEWQGRLEPLVVSWGWGGAPAEPGRFQRVHEYQGTRDVSAYLAVPEAIRFMTEHDWPAVQAECHGLVRWFREEMARRTGREPLTPDGPEWFRQMVAVPLPPVDPTGLQRRLLAEYKIEVPIHAWDGRQFIRLSIQAYNTRQDVDTLLHALEKLVLNLHV